MRLTTEDVFNNAATASQKLLLELQMLANAGSGAVLSPATENGGAPSRRTATADAVADFMHVILQQQREEQIRLLNQKLDDLDRRIAEGLRDAEERLAEIRRTANRAKDGRIVFRDEDDGKIYDEFDNEVGDEEIDWTKWNPDLWTRQQFDGAIGVRDQWAEAREKAGAVRDRMAGDLTDDDLTSIHDDLGALAMKIDGFESSPSPFTAVPSDPGRTAGRATSAAKMYDGPTGSDAGINVIFQNASLPSDPVPEDKPALVTEPDTSFAPR